MEEILKISNIKPKFAQPRQHNTMGSVENANKVMEEIIRKFIDKRNQDDWDSYVRLAAQAINQTISATHKFAPDFLFFGRDPINPYLEVNNDFIQEDNVRYDIYTKQFKESMTDAFIYARKNLENYRNTMIKQNDKKLGARLPIIYKPDDFVYMEKPVDVVTKGLSHKLDDNAMGPFKVIEVDNEKGNIVIEIAPGKHITVKHHEIRKAKDQMKHQDVENKLKPTSINEVIIIDDVEYLSTLVGKRSRGIKPKKQNFTVKTLVGKRIDVHWKTGVLKGWHEGTIIGYTSNLNNNLIYYDQRDDQTNPIIDYYSHNLFGNAIKWEFY